MRLHHTIIALLAATSAVPSLAAAAPAETTVVDPERQALAARVAASLWPDGTYGRMIDSMIGGKDGLKDMFLDMSPSDFMGGMAETMAGEGKPTADVKEGPDTPSLTFREMFKAEDPHFEERMRITMNVVGEEVRRISKPIEPRLRDGLSKSIARRFTRDQLAPIAAFLETEPGRAFAAQWVTLFIDKDVMLAMIQSVPAMVKEMPTAMKKVEAATAHLPKPPKKAESKDEGAEADEEEESDNSHD